MVVKASFILLARGMLGRSSGRVESATRDYVSLFGISARTTVDVWNRCDFDHEAKLRPKHLLWALLMMKTYSSQAIMAALAGTTRKTFRKWAWKAMRVMADSHSDIVSGLFVFAAFTCCYRC